MGILKTDSKGTVYVLNNGVYVLFIPEQQRVEANLKDKEKVLFGVVKARNEFYFIKNSEATGRLSRRINFSNTGGTLVTIPKAIADLMELKHKDKIIIRVAKRIYISKEE